MANRESFKRPHAGLLVWQDAMELVEMVYGFSGSFPDDERFGLTAQIRRAAVSIPSNIAESAARRSRPEFRRFLSMARGSLSELDTQCQIAERLKYGQAPANLPGLIDRVFARLTALLNTLNSPGGAQ